MKLHHDNWWCLLGQLWGFVRYCKKWCEIVRNSRTNLGTPWGLARHLGTAAKSHQTSRYFETCPTIFLLWLSEIVRNCENWWDMYHGVQANMFSCRQCKSSKSKTDLVIFISRWYTSTLLQILCNLVPCFLSLREAQSRQFQTVHYLLQIGLYNILKMWACEYFIDDKSFIVVRKKGVAI